MPRGLSGTNPRLDSPLVASRTKTGLSKCCAAMCVCPSQPVTLHGACIFSEGTPTLTAAEPSAMKAAGAAPMRTASHTSAGPSNLRKVLVETERSSRNACHHLGP